MNDDTQKLLQAVMLLLGRVEACENEIAALRAAPAAPAPRRTRKPLTYEMWQKVVECSRGGMSLRKIAELHGIAVSTVSQYAHMGEEEALGLKGAPAPANMDGGPAPEPAPAPADGLDDLPF